MKILSPYDRKRHTIREVNHCMVKTNGSASFAWKILFSNRGGQRMERVKSGPRGGSIKWQWQIRNINTFDRFR